MTNDSIGSNSVTDECFHVYNCLIYQCCPHQSKIFDADHIRILSIVSNLPQPCTPQGNSLTHMGLDHRGVWHRKQQCWPGTGERA